MLREARGLKRELPAVRRARDPHEIAMFNLRAQSLELRFDAYNLRRAVVRDALGLSPPKLPA